MWFSKNNIYFGCNKCGDCCRDMDIPLSHYDIFRIINVKPELPPDLFISLYPGAPKTTFSVLLNENYYILYLSNKITDNSCVFLINNVCSIYDYRPNTCRTWPFSKNSLEKLLIDPVAKDLVIKSCDQKRFRKYKKTLQQINHGITEVSEYLRFIGQWNKQVINNPEQQSLGKFIEKIKIVLG